MLTILHSTSFDKRFKVLSKKLRRKTFERLSIFMVDEYAEILNNHPLHGEYAGCRSINITGNWRLIYEKTSSDTCRLLEIGTHGQLYE